MAAVARRTQRIRVGHAVTLLTAVAERIGALDIVSKGRLEFGTGRS